MEASAPISAVSGTLPRMDLSDILLDDPSDSPDPLDALVIDDPIRLLRAWRHLLRPERLAASTLWLLLIDAYDQPLPGLIEVEDVPELPSPDELDALIQMLRHFVEDEGGRVAMARSRPGGHPADATDRRWAAEFHAACRRGGVSSDVVHLATPDRIVPLPADDLPASA